MTDAPVIDGLLTEVEYRRPDLVVLATHGRSELGRLAFGTVARRVVTEIDIPVLLIRACHTPVPVPPLIAGLRILVPVDGSDFGEEALPPATALADLLDVEIVLLRAVSPFEPSESGVGGGASI